MFKNIFSLSDPIVGELVARRSSARFSRLPAWMLPDRTASALAKCTRELARASSEERPEALRRFEVVFLANMQGLNGGVKPWSVQSCRQAYLRVVLGKAVPAEVKGGISLRTFAVAAMALAAVGALAYTGLKHTPSVPQQEAPPVVPLPSVSVVKKSLGPAFPKLTLAEFSRGGNCPVKQETSSQASWGPALCGVFLLSSLLIPVVREVKALCRKDYVQVDPETPRARDDEDLVDHMVHWGDWRYKQDQKRSFSEKVAFLSGSDVKRMQISF